MSKIKTPKYDAAVRKVILKLAFRTLAYISVKGRRPEKLLKCDCEMWDYALTVLACLGVAYPKLQKTDDEWQAQIAEYIDKVDAGEL